MASGASGARGVQGSRDRVGAERAPVGLRGGAAPGAEVVPERGGVTEPGPVRDHVDRLGRLLQQLLGQQDALAGQPPHRGGARLLHEPPGEGALGHAGPGGELVDRDRLAEVALHPADDLAQRVAGGHRDRPVHVLGLAALAVGRDDHPPGDAVGHPGPLLFAHQVQARVDARRGARAGDHRVLIDVEHLGVDHGRGIQPGQVRGVPPVRGAPPPVQQPGRPEHERAVADAEHPGPAVHGGAQRVDQRRRELAGRVGLELAVADRRHRHQVRLRQPVQAIGRGHGEARRRGQRGRFARHHGEVVGGQPVVGPVDAEHLAQHAQLEGSKAVQDDHGHVVQHGSIMHPDWQDLTPR